MIKRKTVTCTVNDLSMISLIKSSFAHMDVNLVIKVRPYAN